MTDILTIIFTFTYSIGHWIGEVIVWIIQSISGVMIPSAIIDAIGLLAILTIFLTAVDIAKRLVWIIVIVSWILIIVRIIMLMIGI